MVPPSAYWPGSIDIDQDGSDGASPKQRHFTFYTKLGLVERINGQLQPPRGAMIRPPGAEYLIDAPVGRQPEVRVGSRNQKLRPNAERLKG